MPSRCASTGTRASAWTRATSPLPPRGTIMSISPAARSIALAHGIVEVMRRPIHLDGATVIVSVSVGAVPHGDPATLARNADVALYAAKRGGRGRAVLFDASLHEALLHRFELRDLVTLRAGESGTGESS